jgi:hypothetical protein
MNVDFKGGTSEFFVAEGKLSQGDVLMRFNGAERIQCRPRSDMIGCATWFFRHPFCRSTSNFDREVPLDVKR